MTAGAVTYSNLVSEPWQHIYELLNSRSNISDPTVGSAEYRKIVYARDPDVKSANFAGFPFIIVRPSTPNLDDGGKSLDMNSRFIAFGIDVEVVTCDREYNNRDGFGATDNDSLSNSVVKVLNNVSNRKTLQTNGLYDLKLEVTSVVVEERENTLIYRRVIVISMRSRLKVSA